MSRGREKNFRSNLKMVATDTFVNDFSPESRFGLLFSGLTAIYSIDIVYSKGKKAVVNGCGQLVKLVTTGYFWGFRKVVHG